jgi:hypothetical protein
MRWSVYLKSPVIAMSGVQEAFGDAREGGTIPWEGPDLLLGPDPQGREARVTVSDEDGTLLVRVVAEAPVQAGARPDHEEYWNRAYLEVLLNPGHDHGTRWQFAVDDRGEVYTASQYAVQGEESGDESLASLDSPPRTEGTFHWMESGGYEAEVRIPSEGLWRDAGTPVGFAVRVGFHEAVIPDPLAWPDRVAWAGSTPLAFGDLYRAAPDLAITEIDIKRPHWGGSPTEILLRGRVAPSGPAGGVLRGRVELPGDRCEDLPGVPWASRDGDVVIAAPVVFPFRAKWANGLVNIARLHLWLSDEKGREVWRAAFPFGFDHGIIVRERFGGAAGEPAARPDAGSATFLEDFRQYILTRLPDYRMQTTREGAPSDFYLADPDGGDSADMSADNSLSEIARMLVDRFPDWQDALCAAAMWVHHPLVTRHSSTWSRVSNRATVETLPRLAGCFCGDTTRLTAALAEKIGDRLGVPVAAYSMGLRGHLATLVDTPVGKVVLDGMLGLWFHTMDNRRLATLEEMRVDREIAERVWYAPRAHGHEFFHRVDNQLIRPWQTGSLKWPEEQA